MHVHNMYNCANCFSPAQALRNSFKKITLFMVLQANKLTATFATAKNLHEKIPRTNYRKPLPGIIR